jgi:hypothetical protein
MLSCRFSLSEAGADLARQLRDKGGVSPSSTLADAAPCIIPVDMSGDWYADGAAARNRDNATTCVSDNRPAISVKRKTNAKAECKTNHPNSVSAVSHVTSFQEVNVHHGIGCITHDLYFSGLWFLTWPEKCFLLFFCFPSRTAFMCLKGGYS